jgi:hypothetical protein
MFNTVFGNTYFLEEDILFESVGPNTPFYNDLNKFLSLPAPKDPSQNGKAEGTVRFPKGIIHLTDFDKLWNILLPYYTKIGKAIGKPTENIQIKRAWSNRMYLGSAGGIHKHTDDIDFVSIFYYQAPHNSGNIVFVNPDTVGEEFKNKTLEHFDKKDKVEIPVRPGTLLCHPPGIWHGITTHNSEIPRICIVIEIRFEK